MASDGETRSHYRGKTIVNQDSKESTLSRWSRRKLEADQLAPVVEESTPPEATIGLTAAATEEAEVVEKPVLTDADMPDIESLNEDSDFSGFMSTGVSDKLRNMALRKLFQAPVFNIRDGLDEYDEDYTHFEKLGDIVTCDMKHEIEMQEQKQREAEEAAAAEQEEMAEETEIEDDGIEAIEEDGLEAELDQQTEIEAEAELEPKPKQELDDEQ
jgi:TATA-binding protein-associated factor Taf7